METNSTAAEGSKLDFNKAPPQPKENGHDTTEANDATDKLQAIAVKYDLKPTGSDPHQRLLDALTEAYDLGAIEAADELRAEDENELQDAGDLTLGVHTLAGDLRDWVLGYLRTARPWSDLKQREQERIINRVTEKARQVTRDVVSLVAHHGFEHVAVITGKLEIDKNIILRVGANPSIENINALARHGRGTEAVLVLTQATDFLDARAEALADLDEPELPIGEATGDGVSHETAAADLPPHDPETGEIIDDTAGASQEAAPAGEGEATGNQPEASPSADPSPPNAKHFFKAIADDGTIFLRASSRPGFIGATPNGGEPPFAASWSRKSGMGTITAHEIDRVEFRELEKRAKAGGKVQPYERNEPFPASKPPIGTSGDPELDAAIDQQHGELPAGPVGKTHTGKIGAAIGADDRPYSEILREQNEASKPLTRPRSPAAEAARANGIGAVDEFGDL